jgi:uncharacterized protein (DUF4415 family)
MRDDYDFKGAKPVSEVRELARLRAEQTGKTRITIRIDTDVLDWFRARVTGGGSYQNTINEALRAHMMESDGVLERTLRRVIREEMAQHGRP